MWHRILLLFVLFCACAPEKPEYILDQDRMVELITEIHIIESQIKNRPGLDSKEDFEYDIYLAKKKVYEAYNIDSAIFLKSYEYYYEQGKILAIYDSASAKLSEKQKKLKQY